MERRAYAILERAKQIHFWQTAAADFASLPAERKGELLQMAEDELLKEGAIGHVDQS